MTTTPNIETDVIARLVALLPSQFSTTGAARNVWPGLEQPIGGSVLVTAAFVRVFGERVRIHSDGQWREVDVQITQRFAREGERLLHDAGTYAAAEVKARAVYDALQLSGGFTGSSGARYMDVRAITSPAFLEPSYFSHNYTFWLDA